MCFDGAIALASTLKKQKSLVSLNLSTRKLSNVDGNNIIGAGASSIGEAIRSHRNLTSLKLGHNNIDVEGAKVIAEALKEFEYLTVLDLCKSSIACIGYNNFERDGAVAIAEAIKRLHSLSILDLGIEKA